MNEDDFDTMSEEEFDEIVESMSDEEFQAFLDEYNLIGGRDANGDRVIL